jgi:putative transposase
MIDDGVTELTRWPGCGRRVGATGRAQASHYRRHRQTPQPPRPVRVRRARAAAPLFLPSSRSAALHHQIEQECSA